MRKAAALDSLCGRSAGVPPDVAVAALDGRSAVPSYWATAPCLNGGNDVVSHLVFSRPSRRGQGQTAVVRDGRCLDCVFFRGGAMR